MAFTFDNVQGGVADFQQTGGLNDGTYMDTVDPTKLLDDPRFIADMREYYRMNGKSFDSDQKMLEQWYDDRTYAELNLTFGTLGDVADNMSIGARERELKKRMVKGYQLMPFFWQEGGFGERSGTRVAKSIGKAIATDPINLLGPARALPAAGKAYQAAAIAGRTGPQATRAAALQGGKTGAITEAAVAAPITAGADVAVQGRDIQLGLQEDIDAGRVLLSGAAGAGLGVGLGGTLGTITGAVGGRQQARKLQLGQLSQMYEQRPGDFAVPLEVARENISGDIAQNQRMLNVLQQDADDTAAARVAADQPVPGEEPLRPGMRAEDVDIDAAAVNLRAAQEELQRAYRDKVDPEIIEDLERDATEARTIYSLAERIQREEFEIDRLIESNVDTERSQGLSRWRSLQKTIGEYRRLIERSQAPEGASDADIAQAQEVLALPPPPDSTTPATDFEVAGTRPLPEDSRATAEGTVYTDPEGRAAVGPDNPNAPQQPAIGQDRVPLLPDQATRRAPGEGDVVSVDAEGAATVERGAAAEPTRTVKPLEEIYFDEVYKVEETGEVVPAKKSAAKAYAEVTQRIDNMYSLRKCLGI